MVKAYIKTKDGTKIEIDGTPEELNKIINVHNSTINSVKMVSGNKNTERVNTKWLSKLARDCKVTEEQIASVVDSDGEGRLINTNIKGKNELERQFNSVLCIGTISYYNSGSNFLTSKYLHKELEWLGLKSLQHLGSNLKNRRPHVVPNGKPKSVNFSYKISKIGIEKGLVLIKEMCG